VPEGSSSDFEISLGRSNFCGRAKVEVAVSLARGCKRHMHSMLDRLWCFISISLSTRRAKSAGLIGSVQVDLPPFDNQLQRTALSLCSRSLKAESVPLSMNLLGTTILLIVMIPVLMLAGAGGGSVAFVGRGGGYHKSKLREQSGTI
jgi:hypothetical protein